MELEELAQVVDAAREHDPTAQWGYGSRVSTEHRYVYLSVPKVACSTIKLALHRFEGFEVDLDRWGQVHEGSWGLSLLDQPTDTVVETLTSADYLRFGFVRNPYDRLLSAWKQKLATENDAGYKELRAAIRDAFDYPVIDGERTGAVSFRDSVEVLLDPSSPVFFDAHWQRQVDVLLADVVDLDVIGRFENFADDFTAILRRLDAPPDLLSMATTIVNGTSPVPLTAAYDTDLARRVFDHYEADFETYRYDKDSWLTH